VLLLKENNGETPRCSERRKEAVATLFRPRSSRGPRDAMAAASGKQHDNPKYAPTGSVNEIYAPTGRERLEISYVYAPLRVARTR